MSDSDMPTTYDPATAEAAVQHMANTMGLKITPPFPGAPLPKSPPLITTRAPDLQGPHARAWRFRGGALTPDQSATLMSYLVNFPASHPLWPTYTVSVIHLRDIPGVAPANKDYPEAEFEFMVVALDPNGTLGHPLATDDIESWHHLVPLNVRVQFNAANDEDAKQRCTDAVTLICQHGVGIEPDDDARVRPWWTESIRRGFNPQEGQHR